jgi:hypothetical protein
LSAVAAGNSSAAAWPDGKLRKAAKGAKCKKQVCDCSREAEGPGKKQVQCHDGAKYIEQAMRERFTKFNLEFHPDKSRIINFGRKEQDKADRSGHQPNTFDFSGFTHYWAKVGEVSGRGVGKEAARLSRTEGFAGKKRL